MSFRFLNYFFKEVSVLICSPFLYGLILLYIFLSSTSVLYFLAMISLSNEQRENTFSNFVGYLYALVMIFFEVLNLPILMQSHLFVFISTCLDIVTYKKRKEKKLSSLSNFMHNNQVQYYTPQYFMQDHELHKGNHRQNSPCHQNYKHF